MRFRSITTFAVVALAAVLWAMPNNSAVADDDGNDNNSQSWKAYGAGFGVTLEAGYEEDTNRNGTIDQKLEVEVNNAPANLTVDVLLNGSVIGSMRTNSRGEGKFKMTQYGVKAGRDGRPTGARIDSGDVIEVSSGSASVSGTFQKEKGDGGNGDDGDDDGNGDDGDGDGGDDGDGN